MTEKTWHRRIIPKGYISAKLNLIGTSPLLMKSGDCDPDSELYRAFQLMGTKRAKTMEDKARLREMEWIISLYMDEEIGPYIPGKNIKEMIRSAATKWKRGEDIKRSLIVVDERIPLLYEGPRDQDGLWKAGFRYTTKVVNNGIGAGRVDRCRPMFRDWSLEAEIAFDPEDLDFDFLNIVIERTKKYGLGDYRPVFGSFDASLVMMEANVPASNGSSIKILNDDETKGHAAFVNRIKKIA